MDPPAHGTIINDPRADLEADAKALRTAMKGMGTDEKAIIQVLSRRTAQQRLTIATKYKVMFGKDLVKDLKSELSGNFEAVVVRLIMDLPQFDAMCLRNAMKGAGTDEAALIEVLCTRTNTQISDIKRAYTELYPGRSLEKDVVSETSGHFKRLLVSALQGAREEGVPVDWAKAQREAQELYRAGAARWGTDESKFNEILMLRSFPQLRATFEEYRKVASTDIVRTVSKEFSGSIEAGFKAVVMSAVNRADYFAERLYKAMHGMGTDDETLIRVIVARSEIDMVEIKEAFFAKYRKSLAHMIKDDTSGDYKRMLIALVGD